MGRLKLFCFLVLTISCSFVHSANILGLFSSLSYSDHQVFRGYISRLARAGHSVVLMTAYPGHFAYPESEKIVELDVSQESVTFWSEWLKLVTNTDDYYTRMSALNDLSVKLAIAQLKSKALQTLLQNPKAQFDLVVTEADVPILYGAAEKYKAPHIAITASSGKIHQYESKGSPTHPFLYPDVNSFNYGDLTLFQKWTELSRYEKTKREYYYNYLPICELAAKNIFAMKRELQDIEYDIDLLFVTASPMLTGNRPTSPAVVFTDRMHINPGFSLPQNLKLNLDGAQKGVIYFSIGAVQESETLSPTVLQTLATAFGELPYTVLWKIGNTTAFSKPDNVIAGAWFPQQEVLAHPNVKVFITHGGPRSLEEAIFYEVPIVGLPIVKSRRVFTKEITKRGAGEIVDPYNLKKDDLKAVIMKVATQGRYKQAMSKLKLLVNDPTLSGPDHAVWWTEAVLRSGGAKHLRSPAAGLSTFGYFEINALAFLSFAILLAIWISYTASIYLAKKLRLRFSNPRIFNKEDRKFKAL